MGNNEDGSTKKTGFIPFGRPKAFGDKPGDFKDKDAGSKRKVREDPSVAQRRRLSRVCGACVGVTVISLGLSGAMLASANSLRDRLIGNTENVVTVSQDVTAGTTLDASKLEVTAVPKAFVPSDAIVASGTDDAAVKEATDKVSGRRALAHLTAGNPISGSTISTPDSPTALAQVPAQGSVAYMISLDTANGLAPFLRVGDKVDVYSGSDQVTPQKLFGGVRVIALDGSLTGGGTNTYSTVTLELTDSEALQLFNVGDVAGSTLHLALTPEASLVDADATAQAAQTSQAAPTTDVAQAQTSESD